MSGPCIALHTAIPLCNKQGRPPARNTRALQPAAVLHSGSRPTRQRRAPLLGVACVFVPGIVCRQYQNYFEGSFSRSSVITPLLAAKSSVFLSRTVIYCWTFIIQCAKGEEEGGGRRGRATTADTRLPVLRKERFGKVPRRWHASAHSQLSWTYGRPSPPVRPPLPLAAHPSAVVAPFMLVGGSTPPKEERKNNMETRKCTPEQQRG